MRDDASRGLALVAGATFFWSLSGVFARWLPQVDPWTFNATRGLGMGVALLVWIAWEYRLGALRLFTQSDPVALLISGGFFAAGSSLYILALKLSSVAAASCIGATSGIFAALMARVWLGERTPAVFYVAVVMAFAGVILIALGEASVATVGSLGGIAVSLADAVLNPLWVWLVHREVPATSVYWGGAVILLAIGVSAWPSLMAARTRS